MSQRIEDLFDQSPVNQLIGMKLLERHEHGARVVFDPRVAHTQGYGLVQGGMISALADAAGVCAFLRDPGEGGKVTSIEFKLNFLRPAFPDRGRIEARAKVVQRGRRIGLADVDVEQAGELVAKGLFTYLLD